MSNYTLEIISHHPKFNNKALHKYHVDGIDTVGVWGDEPFEIRFKNHTWQKVQVKLSLDGTDILTGKLADTNVSENMWVVNGNDTLSIKAWPENNFGGAAFIFTSANNSVAAHTHGNLSSRGIIAAAVFTEGHIEPIRFNHISWPVYPVCPTYPVYPLYPRPYYDRDFTYGTSITNTSTYDSSVNSVSLNNASNNFAEIAASNFVSVGAGEYVDQKILHVQGLIKPLLTETVKVKYEWWDNLVEKLRTETVSVPHPSGFPADQNKNIDLGKTPRITSKNTLIKQSDKQSELFNRI